MRALSRRGSRPLPALLVAGDLNIVEVYVGYLRRKIDAPYGRAAIATVRGAGYRLNGDGG